MEKELPIYRLDIVEDLESNVEVDFVALVDRPAIEKSFLAFQDSYSDYPDSVSNNAKAALKWAEENGWGSCGTPVGKQRANQLAKGEAISFETIKRMYSFLSRHKENAEKSKGYGDGCGQLMYDAWGGASALSWAEAKINSIEKQKFAIQDEEERIISGALMLADTPIYRNDANGEYYVVFTKDTIKKIAQKYFKKGYQNNVNLMHDSGQVMDGITMFESWIVDENRGIKPMKGFEDVKDGSWFGSFKVENDEVWQMIKDGKVQGFSVEGIFNYKTNLPEPTKEEKMMQDIINILEQVDMFWEEEDVERDESGRFAPKGGGGGKEDEGKIPQVKKNENPVDTKVNVEVERPEWSRKNDKYESAAKETINKILEDNNWNSGTDKFYSDKSGRITEERLDFHNKLAGDYIGGSRSKDYQDTGTSYFMGGAPATGKSSIEKGGLVEFPKGILKVDPDGIKDGFPEYREMLNRREFSAASRIHEESSKVSKDIVKTAAKNKWDIVVDAVGDGTYQSVIDKVKQQRDAGKRVVAHYVTTDTEVSVKRAEERARKTGRYVPEKYIRDMHREISVLLPKFAKNNVFDELHLYDNNGKKPKLIFSHTNGKSTIYDRKAYNKFLAKAKES
jgi:predicted ABC-type ATPase